MVRKYGKKSQASVKKAMHKYKAGKLKSGKSGKTVKSRKQAIAIVLSEARAKGAKVPAKRGTAKRATTRRTTARKASTHKTTARRTTKRAVSRRK